MKLSFVFFGVFLSSSVIDASTTYHYWYPSVHKTWPSHSSHRNENRFGYGNRGQGWEEAPKHHHRRHNHYPMRFRNEQDLEKMSRHLGGHSNSYLSLGALNRPLFHDSRKTLLFRPVTNTHFTTQNHFTLSDHSTPETTSETPTDVPATPGLSSSEGADHGPTKKPYPTYSTDQITTTTTSYPVHPITISSPVHSTTISSPAHSSTSSPVHSTSSPVHSTSSPVHSSTSSPVHSSTSSPVHSTTSSPVRSTTSSPVYSTPSSPVHSTTISTPVHSTTSVPVHSSTSSPVYSTTISSPVHSTTISSPVHSTTISSPVHSTTISTPVHSTTSSPVYSTTISSPVYSTTSYPVYSTTISSPVQSTTSSPVHSTTISSTTHSTTSEPPGTSASYTTSTRGFSNYHSTSIPQPSNTEGTTSEYPSSSSSPEPVPSTYDYPTTIFHATNGRYRPTTEYSEVTTSQTQSVTPVTPDATTIEPTDGYVVSKSTTQTVSENINHDPPASEPSTDHVWINNYREPKYTSGNYPEMVDTTLLYEPTTVHPTTDQTANGHRATTTLPELTTKQVDIPIYSINMTPYTTTDYPSTTSLRPSTYFTESTPGTGSPSRSGRRKRSGFDRDTPRAALSQYMSRALEEFDKETLLSILSTLEEEYLSRAKPEESEIIRETFDQLRASVVRAKGQEEESKKVSEDYEDEWRIKRAAKKQKTAGDERAPAAMLELLEEVDEDAYSYDEEAKGGALYNDDEGVYDDYYYYDDEASTIEEGPSLLELVSLASKHRAAEMDDR